MRLGEYPESRDSCVQWIGKLPTHWRVGKTKFFADLRSGHTPSRSRSEYWVGCNIPWFSLADVWQIRDGKRVFLAETKEKISALGLANSAAELLPAGTIIVSRTASVGFSGIARVPMATTQDFVNWIPGPSLVSKFLLFVFRAMEAEFNRLKMGSTHKTIYMPDVRQFTTPVPPLEEQLQIAKFLDYETAKIDALIEKQQQLIALLKEKRQAVISHAVTKGLNPDAPMRDSGVDWLGEVPAHWTICRLKQATSFITSGPRGWSDLISEEGSDLFLQSGDLNDKLGLRLETAKRITTPRNAEGVRTRMQDGDVVVCITGANTGRVAFAHRLRERVFVNQHLSLVRPVRERARSKFLATLLASSSVREYFAVKQYGLKEGLSLTNVAEAPVCLPPPSEQKAIEAYLTAAEDRLEQLEAVAADQVALLQERRTALISAAVTGKIDVRGWKSPESETEAEAP